jgi:hypothetical protein
MLDWQEHPGEIILLELLGVISSLVGVLFLAS